MHVDFIPFQKEWIEAVAQFNRRLREGGQTVFFPESPIPEWLPDTENPRGCHRRGGGALVRWMTKRAWILSRLSANGKCQFL